MVPMEIETNAESSTKKLGGVGRNTNNAGSSANNGNNSLSAKEAEVEVKKFLAGTSRHSQTSPELTRSALLLLQNVPATRIAVLDYFGNVFLSSVNKHVRQIENNQKITVAEESAIAEIQSVLSVYLTENAQAWAPIISTWSLNLLGKISTDNAKRGILRVNSGINDFLQQWMSCRATRTLINLTSQCLECLMNADTESCVKALLETSVAHSPHFDWVVTHVGSCFPKMVITRVLSCGLKDFYALDLESSNRGNSSYLRLNSKLNSVISILGHLAANHSYEIRAALLDLFQWSLLEDAEDDSQTKAQKLAAVPFLLNLASLSSNLARIIANHFLHILNPGVIPQLALFAEEWCKYFGRQPETLIELTAHLALGCEQGGLSLINILLDASLSTSNVGYHSVNVASSVKSVCRQLLELILGEMDLMSRTHEAQTGTKGGSTALLDSLRCETTAVAALLVDPEPLRVRTAARILSLLAAQQPNVLVSSGSHLLRNACTDLHLAALVRFLTDNAYAYGARKNEPESNLPDHEVFSQVLEYSLKDCSTEVLRRVFQNLGTILRWEKSRKVACLESGLVSRAFKANLHQVGTLLLKTSDLELAGDIIAVLDILELPEHHWSYQSVQLVLKMTRAMVRYFFLCVAEQDVVKKCKGARVVCRFLWQLSLCSACARTLALRQLLEQSIFGEVAEHFGAKGKFREPTTESPPLLLRQNHSLVTSVMLAQRHSSIFHSGVIGLGPRKPSTKKSIDQHDVTLNITLLVDAIKACCTNSNGIQKDQEKRHSVNVDFLTIVSLMLVELISPDVMYNGLPWPEEEFTKVTVERDLQIRRMFEDGPHLWTLLELTAWYRPTLAFCSVLLRAIAASTIANWDPGKGLSLANVMALGQLLPSPLASIRDVLPVLEPQQIQAVMRECIWAYMHENVPSPALFTRSEGASVAWRDTDTSVPNVRFTETLRLLLLANIHKLGSLYFMLFYLANNK